MKFEYPLNFEVEDEMGRAYSTNGGEAKLM
jgi:hypothetical protein